MPHGFPAIARLDARVLILGSLPGAESLKQAQYYAKKQNSFWKIMGDIAGTSPDLPYSHKQTILKEHHIALWDVCASAEREGSLDSNILAPVANDFVSFFKKHKHVGLIAFNGQPAAKLYKRLVVPTLAPSVAALPFVVLPSTSPAHASLRFEQKLQIWRQALIPAVRGVS